MSSQIAHHLSEDAYVVDDSTTYDFYLGTERTSRQEAKFRLELSKRSWKKERPLTQQETRAAGNYALSHA